MELESELYNWHTDTSVSVYVYETRVVRISTVSWINIAQVFVGFFSSSRIMLGHSCKLGHDNILPLPFQFVICCRCII